MKQLIEIQIVPGQFELRKVEPKIEYVNASVAHTMKKVDGGGIQMDYKPQRMHVDTFQARNSVRPDNMMEVLKEATQKGRSKASQGTATYAQRGQMLLKVKKGEELISQFARQDTYKDVKMNIGIDFIPKAGPDITWDPGEINSRFEKDRLEFDWKMTEQELRFTPGSIRMEMTQRPDVIVRYVGGFTYVPENPTAIGILA